MKKYIITIIALAAVLNACNRADIVPEGSANDEKVFSVVVDAPVSVKSAGEETCREMKMNADVESDFSVSLFESSRPAPAGVSTKVAISDVIVDNSGFKSVYGSVGFELYAIGEHEDGHFLHSLGDVYYNNSKNGWLLSDPSKNPASYAQNVFYVGLAPKDGNALTLTEEAGFELYCTPDIDKQENIMLGLSYALYHPEDYYCLHFMHATSMIMFNFVTPELYNSAVLKSIGLYGIHDKGRLLLEDISENEQPKWRLECGYVYDSTDDYVLTDTAPLNTQALFVVPTTASGYGPGENPYIKAVIEVPGSDGPVTINAQASLENVSWNPGYIYYYTVKLRDLVTPDGSTEDYTGGSSYDNSLFN